MYCSLAIIGTFDSSIDNFGNMCINLIYGVFRCYVRVKFILAFPNVFSRHFIVLSFLISIIFLNWFLLLCKLLAEMGSHVKHSGGRLVATVDSF